MSCSLAPDDIDDAATSNKLYNLLEEYEFIDEKGDLSQEFQDTKKYFVFKQHQAFSCFQQFATNNEN